ncbi:MAG: L7Ae/L30e/S12e/Gadd45 family ribosomal protein [Velocimicrobium sp.]
MNQNKVLSYIGLATKSGKISSGEFSTEKAVKEGKAKLVIVAEDASANTKKMFQNMCDYYQVPIHFLSEKGELGHAMGKQFRASLAILDQGLADAIIKQLK